MSSPAGPRAAQPYGRRWTLSIRQTADVVRHGPAPRKQFDRRAQRHRRSIYEPGGGSLDRLADRAQDRLDVAAQENEGDDRDDRDEGEDQRVLRETLAFLVAAKR